jgi:hypothetical protein
MNATQLRRLEKLERDRKVGEVDMAAGILQGREDARAGTPPAPFTAERIDNMQRSPLGRAILAARRRVGWL